jgi:hypothetical protein
MIPITINTFSIRLIASLIIIHFYSYKIYSKNSVNYIFSNED